MQTIRTIQLEQEANCLRKALRVAVGMLAPIEPPDNRVVSDDFVAIAAVLAGDCAPNVMAVIDAAIQREPS